MRKGAREGQAVWTLFRVQGEDYEGGVVFEGEELQGCEIVSNCVEGVVEGIEGVQEASSKGWMSFFFVNFSTKGRLRVLRSVTASLRICDVFWPETKRVVFGFSVCWGSRLSMARLARAFLGFLETASVVMLGALAAWPDNIHCLQHDGAGVRCECNGPTLGADMELFFESFRRSGGFFADALAADGST